MTPLVPLGFILAAAAPGLLAYNLPPSATLLNQCVAVALWGAWLLVARPGLAFVGGRSLLGALGVVALAALGAGTLGALPAALTLAALALVAAAAVLASAGLALARRGDAAAQMDWFATGLLVAGLLSTLVALVQVFVPGWADGKWIAVSGLPGRAVGNLRQPNHLCSLLTWGLLGAALLHERRALSRPMAWAVVVAMVFAVELSASRTGAAGLLLLAAWGALDRRLARGTRVLLVAMPLLYALAYGAMAAYGQWSAQVIGAGARLVAEDGAAAAAGDSPNSRWRIWANAWALVVQQPWTGVGFGEFNLAWSLTPFPGRPTAFFDHTHNLPLQLAAELGLPGAAAVMALLVAALAQGWRRARAATGANGAAAMTAWMVVLLIGLHSMVEYPLWYAYFLLPAALAWGFTLGIPAGGTADDGGADAGAAPASGRAPRAQRASGAVGALLLAGGVLAVVDYGSVVAIYAPPAEAGPLEARIAAGQRSVLFAHHADYAAATHDEPLPGTALAFERAPHHLLDTRLMMAWAEYLALTGRVDLARELAQRLREFRNPDADKYFAACADAAPQPYQCQPPAALQGWRAFLPRR